MLDYPDSLAAIAWFAGCNMRCGYCYNPHIVLGEGRIATEKLLEFLRKRKDKLEAVVLSGGECTNFAAIGELCAEIKKIGYKVKIDTNGSRPERLSALIAAKAIDYVALDFKAPREKFREIAGADFYDQTLQSLRLLIASEIPFEARTTIHSALLTPADISRIAEVLCSEGYKNNYCLQNFVAAKKTLGNLGKPAEKFNLAAVSSPIKVVLR
jgi:pyruvate formate lyase activating enzyme